WPISTSLSYTFLEHPKVITFILFFFNDLVLILFLNWPAKLRFLFGVEVPLLLFCEANPAVRYIFWALVSPGRLTARPKGCRFPSGLKKLRLQLKAEFFI